MFIIIDFKISPCNERFIPSAHTTNEDGIECSETSELKIQNPVNHPKERIQHTVHCCTSGNLKMKNRVIIFVCFLSVTGVELFRINVRGMWSVQCLVLHE